MQSEHIYLIVLTRGSEDAVSAHSTRYGAHEWLHCSPLTPQSHTLVRLLDGLSGAVSGYKDSTPIPWNDAIFTLLTKIEHTKVQGEPMLLEHHSERASFLLEDWPQWAKGLLNLSSTCDRR